MGNPESNNGFTLHKLSPGETIRIFNNLASNPNGRMVFQWRDDKTQKILNSVEINPYIRIQLQRNGVPLDNVYPFIRGKTHEVVVKDTRKTSNPAIIPILDSKNQPIGFTIDPKNLNNMDTLRNILHGQFPLAEKRRIMIISNKRIITLDPEDLIKARMQKDGGLKTFLDRYGDLMKNANLVIVYEVKPTVERNVPMDDMALAGSTIKSTIGQLSKPFGEFIQGLQLDNF